VRATRLLAGRARRQALAPPGQPTSVQNSRLMNRKENLPTNQAFGGVWRPILHGKSLPERMVS
jgi:hypothetical protein